MNDATQQLCLSCGLCCNGVIFADGELRPDDDAEKLRALGLRFKSRRGEKQPQKFHQPCGAFADCRCAIYADRPEYCRAFECRLLKRVNEGLLSPDAALKTIRSAKQKSEKVRRLLRALGCADEHVALSVRFRRLNRRIQSEALDEERADTFGELTIAVHELNVILSREFYPGSRADLDY
jgi:Fe-S-cluster containining protein